MNDVFGRNTARCQQLLHFENHLSGQHFPWIHQPKIDGRFNRIDGGHVERNHRHQYKNRAGECVQKELDGGKFTLYTTPDSN